MIRKVILKQFIRTIKSLLSWTIALALFFSCYSCAIVTVRGGKQGVRAVLKKIPALRKEKKREQELRRKGRSRKEISKIT